LNTSSVLLARERLESRILVYTPTGKDGKLIATVVGRAALECHICTSGKDLTDELAKGAGAIVMADEALTADLLRSLARFLRKQQAWSDLPFLVLSKRGLDSPEMRSIYLKLGNVTLLERPVQTVTLVSAVTSALRARKRQYEMREIDGRKDEFLAMLAHELRNPLAPIGAASDLLRFADLDQARIQQTSEIISRQVRHMTSLIEDLLDVSRVTRGLVTLEHATLDARQVVTSAIEQVRPLIDARNHRLTVKSTPKQACVRGDQKRLIQVVSNLLHNAAKYSPEGGNISLSMEVERQTVIISVADDGVGMVPDVIDRVFEMFSQAERTSDRSQGGLGLGLALVKSLVELHGGTVQAFSDGLGKGSRFTVRLPLAPSAEMSKERALEAGALMTAKGRRLLIVDDNVDAAHMLALVLELAGHETFVEHTAKDALERAHQQAPDACLLDIGLPDMDGNALAKALRAHPATQASVLIAITGYGQEQDKQKTAASGFNHHFVKPVDTEQLLHVLAVSDHQGP
jgi:signal transduction histidine kinase/ActR/RegA family two-component response regulator